MDTLAIDLARFQFAFTVSFHIIFPAFTIGLASYLAVLEGLWLKTGQEKYIQLYKYWMKIFAISFGMGVVSGIVLSYQFGTNWSVFADKTGPILGPLMGYEVFTAFFLEAGFLGVMLFGMEKVGRKLHFASTCIVAFGTFLSAFWILSVNSWMQTPAGYGINEAGQFVPLDWLAIIFNPSFPYRLVHMLLAAYLTTAFVVAAVGAYHLLKAPHNPLAKTMFSMAMWMAAIVTPLQILAGDMHGLNTLAHQPAKVAAMEGHFESRQGAPLILFGIPDEDAQEMKYQIAIPKLGSLILTHDLNGTVQGLDQFPPADHPPVSIVFWSFRVMVGIGFGMLMIGLFSLWLRKKRRLYDSPRFQRLCVLFGPSGFIAVLAGWITTEVGRQPFTVYGLLRTTESASPVDAAAVGASLTAFVIVYLFVFGAGFFYLIRLMRKSPTRYETPPDNHLPDGSDVPPASHPNRLT
ncbi:cytochrome ubiquinol oxidase subunit I [Vibrio quintilis]|uniref:Cytochrome bd-II ubiquinol oxidase subunit 1 n=1 Tax=Vibrio quintilis TaxID=1117707 RepID=A0A1M7YYM9_9VIBR|nr:cytochrome ubiquinol oxidase subunit I [Vibrio quintilis]SHO57741.1 Cytochrome bd-II ubiquinol oxidase subunit 1 [Vibrio quintilis]